MAVETISAGSLSNRATPRRLFESNEGGTQKDVINPVAGRHSLECDDTCRSMSVLSRCKAGDATAWEELFAARAGQVYRWALLGGLRAADAEDAAQEVFAIASRRVSRCVDEKAVTSWLYQITRRVTANHRRRAWVRQWLGSAEPTLERGLVSSPTATDELDVRRCLMQLPVKQREVLLLLELEGFTRQEVAEMLNLPAGTVASRQRLARESFRKAWMAESPHREVAWEGKAR